MFNLSGLWNSRPAGRPAHSLDAFSSESPGAGPVTNGRLQAVPLITAVVLCGTVGGGFLLQRQAFAITPPAFAAMTIESEPAGAVVLLHDIPRGVTPLTLRVPAGEHSVVVEYDRARRPVRVQARAEETVVHHVQFDRAAGPLPSAPLGTFGVATAPPAATASSGAPVAGWLSVRSDIPLDIIENGQVIGTTASARVMVPVGTRVLSLANPTLGFSVERTVRVDAGRTSSVAVDVPRVPLNINAVPWAEVWVDGARVGETPIGNYLVPLGNHEVVMRHPQFGERRQFVSVGLRAPARVSIDLRKVQ